MRTGLSRTTTRSRTSAVSGGAGLRTADVGHHAIRLEEIRLLLLDIGIGSRILVRVEPGARWRVREWRKVRAAVPNEQSRAVERVLSDGWNAPGRRDVRAATGREGWHVHREPG